MTGALWPRPLLPVSVRSATGGSLTHADSLHTCTVAVREALGGLKLAVPRAKSSDHWEQHRAENRLASELVYTLATMTGGITVVRRK